MLSFSLLLFHWWLGGRITEHGMYCIRIHDIFTVRGSFVLMFFVFLLVFFLVFSSCCVISIRFFSTHCTVTGFIWRVQWPSSRRPSTKTWIIKNKNFTWTFEQVLNLSFFFYETCMYVYGDNSFEGYKISRDILKLCTTSTILSLTHSLYRELCKYYTC